MLKLPYQKLQIWAKGRMLVKAIYDLTSTFPKAEQYGLISQMRSAAVSVPSNIAEGSQKTTNKDFLSYLAIAKGSLAELETQIILSGDIGFAKEAQLQPILDLVHELQKMLHAFCLSLTTTH
jgi:four helix bundle protein